MSDTLSIEKRIFRVDASLFSSTIGCEEAILQRLINGYRFPLPSNDMQYGTAFHHFAAEVYRSGGNIGKALQEATAILKKPCNIKAQKAYLNPIHLGTTCISWYDWHKEKDSVEIIVLPDGKPAVEQSFELPVYEDDICAIYLCGTIDKIGKIKNGCYVIDDYKTTSIGRERLEYLSQYELSVQLRTYRYAVMKYAELYPNSVYNELEKSGLGARITGIFLQGAAKPAEFIISDVFQFDEKDMIEYETLLQKSCKKISYVYKLSLTKEDDLDREGMFSGYCAKKYGVCEYFKACINADNPVIKQAILDKNFIKKNYNPLMFGKD